MNLFDQAVQLTQIMLKQQDITPELIRSKAEAVVKMMEGQYGNNSVDLEQLCREVESRCNVLIGEGTILESRKEHQIWLPQKKAHIEWRFWRRYRRYLEEDMGWSESIVNKLDDLTDDILERLEDPTREGSWDRRGMVAGHVQSGKTANYIALINKAADCGYNLIVVLAGMHKSLRSQTQLRIDEGFLGYETQLIKDLPDNKIRIGVGALPGEDLFTVNSLTSSADNGDFNRRFADRSQLLSGSSDPLILVVKKNKSVLSNLLRWARHVVGERDHQTGKVIVRNIPLLLIDDEADNASINTKPVPVDPDTGEQLDDYDVTAINGQIRQLLDSFEKTAYVGYTATPFANIFIYPNGQTISHGDDLFPRSFIVNLPAPSNYISPATVFGIDDDDQILTESQTGLPIIRYVTDYEDYFPSKHKKEHVPPGLPPSLSNAIRYFIISCAAKLARGSEHHHNSMLIHITRFTAVQRILYDLVEEELARLRRRLEFGEGKSSNLIQEMKEIWDNDYIPTFERIREKVEDPLLTELSWSQVSNRLYDAASRIRLKLINGSATDVLDYREHEQGLFAIAIGGEKLSRGLTLEGLTISYYLRASRMYDTLMQMGRWFGYRPGYLDLCRIFTSPELAEWYKSITLANEELRQEFDYMAKIGKTPEEYGLRIRTDADGLLVTAANKMRSGTEMDLSFAGKSSETTIFHRDDAIKSSNYKTVEEFVESLGPTAIDSTGSPRLWKNVKPEKIMDLLSRFAIHPDSRKANGKLLIDYINTQSSQDELVNWTIGLISTRTGRVVKFANQEIGLSIRAKADTSDTHRYCLNKGRLLSRIDESIDLSLPESTDRSELSPSEIRALRPKTDGLMLIYLLESPFDAEDLPFTGLFFSFPESTTAKTIKYKVNNVYWEEEFAA